MQLAAETGSKEAKLQDVKRFCPSISIDFWICMNKTLQGTIFFFNLINFGCVHDFSIVSFKKYTKISFNNKIIKQFLSHV